MVAKSENIGIADDNAVAEMPTEEFFEINSALFINAECFLKMRVHPKTTTQTLLLSDTVPDGPLP